MNLVVTDAVIIALAGAATELAKRCGFRRDYLPLVSVGAGVGFALLLWVASAFPASRELVQALVWGLVAGLTAAGLYDNYRVANPRRPEEDGNRPATSTGV